MRCMIEKAYIVINRWFGRNTDVTGKLVKGSERKKKAGGKVLMVLGNTCIIINKSAAKI